MTRVPIRTRLALLFALGMALVLVVTGLFVYHQLGSDLDDQIGRELSARLAGVVAIIVDDGDDLGDPVRDPMDRVDDEGFVQVLDGEGQVAGATSDELLAEPLLPLGEVQRLASGEIESIDVHVDELGLELRMTAARTRDDGLPYFPIVAASLEPRNQTLTNLSRLLLIGGPFALLVASFAAYAVAAAALRPVESMRAQAKRISAGQPGQRLPVPPARDEIANLGETLNEMLERMERAFERERAFVSDASHELRTPLTILKAEIDLALAAGRSPGELEAALRSASQETNRLVRLADDLLVLARADEGRLPLRPVEIEADALLRRISERFAARGAELGREITAETSDGLVLRADPERIEQALSNLVENALRYSAGPVRLSAERADGHVELHVRDAGPGLPPELLDLAFERFTRATGEQSRGGTGLGLAIVAVIADAHKGSARIENAPDGGADASVRVPAPTP